MVGMHIGNYQVYGDSKIVIQKMRKIQEGKEKTPGRVQKRIMAFILDISKVHYFHVKKQNNKNADKLANMGSYLKQGEISIDHTPPIIKWIACLHGH